MPPLLPQRTLRTEASEGPPPPEPGFWENAGANYRLNEDRQDLLEQSRRNLQAYREALETLDELGVDTSEEGSLYTTADSGTIRTIRMIDRTAIFAEMKRQAERNGSYFKGLPGTQEEYDRQIARRFGERDKDISTATRGGMLTPSGLLGMAASGLTDPVTTIVGMMGGAGAKLGRFVLNQAIVGAGVGVAALPDEKAAMERMGEDFTPAHMALEVGASAAGNVVLGLGIRGAVPAVRGVGRGVNAGRDRIGQAVADNWERIPEPLRQRWANRATLRSGEDDVLLADVAEAAIGRGSMTDAELAAATQLRRTGEIEAANPFVPDGAGLKEHVSRLAMARAALADPGEARLVQPRPRPPGAVVPREPGRSRAAVGSNIDAFMAATRRVESGGDDAARNPRSSASGRYQFTDSTWLATYKAEFPGSGMSPAAILRRKAEPAVQDRLMRRLTSDNAAFFARIGQQATPDNLYLAHFAGPGGAKKVLEAAPGARAADVLGADVARANPFLANWTVRELRDWASRKMGGRGDGDGAAPVRGDDGELARLDGEAAALAAERQAIDAERSALRAGDGDDAPVSPPPTLRQDAFPDEPSWRAAQNAIDAQHYELTAPRERVVDAGDWRDVDKAFDVPESPAGSLAQRRVAERDRLYDDALAEGALDDVLGRAKADQLTAAARGVEAGTVPREVFDRLADEDALRSIARWDASLRDIEDLNYERGAGRPSKSRVAPIEKRLAERGFPEVPPWLTGQDFETQRKWLADNRPTRTVTEDLGDPEFDFARGAARVAAEQDASSPPAIERQLSADREALAAWDDPAGPAAQAQAGSVLHDLKAASAADADAAAGVAVQLDGEGGPVRLDAMLDEIDEDFAIVAAIKGCL